MRINVAMSLQGRLESEHIALAPGLHSLSGERDDTLWIKGYTRQLWCEELLERQIGTVPRTIY